MAKEYSLGVLASGGGSNMAAIHDRIISGDLAGTSIAAVISNKETAGVLGIAEDRDIPAYHTEGLRGEARDRRIVELLRSHNVDLVVAAGYLPVIGRAVLRAYPDKVVGIHPGPLPRYGGKGMHGRHVHAAVLADGIPFSGPTVYLLNEAVDGGQILRHKQVSVLADDDPASLGRRVLAAEHDIFWRVIASLRDRDAAAQTSA